MIHDSLKMMYFVFFFYSEQATTYDTTYVSVFNFSYL